MAKKGSAAPSVRMRRMLSSIHKVNPCTPFSHGSMEDEMSRGRLAFIRD